MAQFPLIDQASLVMIPGAYKEGKIYSQLPTDGSGDFTFTRGTDTATRVNENGLIEKETQNLLTHSGDLTNADWQRINSATYNRTETDPNGGSKAYSFTGGSTNSAVRQTNSLSGGVYTFSVYLKSPTSAPINIRLDSNNGTFENYPCALTTDWQRFEFFYVHNSASLSAWIGGGLSWTTGEEVHIAFPQLEQGLVARDYIETTTVPVYAGLTDNMPRLDYTDATCPSLLLEPSRTNVLGQTEYFGSWPNTEVSLMPNHGSSPEGLNNAYSMSETTATNRHRIFLSSGKAASAIDYCFSVFVKNKSGSRNIRLNLESGIGGNKASVVFDTSGNVVLAASTSGSFANAESFKEQVGDYWKYTLKATSDTSTTLIPIVLLNDGTTEVYAGDGTSGVYIYGAQLEEGSYPTSYIPTYGSSVTRSQDLCTDAGDINTFNSTEGVLYFEGERLSLLGNKRTISISDGSVNNYLYIQFQGVSNTIRIFYKTIEFGQVLLLNHNLSNELGLNKYAFRWSNNNFSLWINGTKELEQLNGSTATSSVFSELNFALGNGLDKFYGDVKQVLVFDSALSDTECIALTTL